MSVLVSMEEEMRMRIWMMIRIGMMALMMTDDNKKEDKHWHENRDFDSD